MKKIFFLVITFLITLIAIADGGYAYAQTEPLTGLRFSSHEVIKDKRTSLNLSPEHPFNFADGFTMEFDAKFRPGDGHYGYIFRIIGNDKVNIDLVSNFWSSSTNFSLVYKDSVFFTYSWKDIPNGDFGSWIKIKVQVDKDSNLTLSFNGNSKKKKIKGLAELQNFNIEFGSSKINSFQTTDVSPMAVKDILLFDSNGELHRNWKLSKHRQDYVYDELSHGIATTHNPNWEIDKHLEWKKEGSFQLDNLIGIAKDEESGRVFMVDKQAVYVYKMEPYSIDSVEAFTLDTLRFTKGEPFPCRGNQIIYNPFTEELWSYDFSGDHISKFNFKTQAWSLSDLDCLTPDLWHHSSIISSPDTTLITFGGYGFYSYKSFFNRYSLHTEKWDQVNLKDNIPPRYMSAMEPYGQEKLLIFGGYGSRTGKQEISPNFYYDLYSIDRKGSRPEKLWELGSIDSPFVPSQALITDTASNSFYTLIYNPLYFDTHLRLANFKIDEPEKQFYADSIPFKFLDIESWSTLFLNKKTSKLIAITKYDTEIELYSLAYPPLLPEDVFQEELTAQSRLGLWSGSIIAGLAFLITVIFFISRKTAKPNAVKEKSHAHSGENAPYLLRGELSQRKTVSSIYLLGGFQVYDKAGSDITANFTPTLKQLFLLIFLSSLKNGKGVSSSKLDEMLWFDKTEESARNNRNVNISKLRVLFKSIDHIDLVFNGTSWKINFGEEFYADYTEAQQLITKSRSSAGLQEEEIYRLLHIASWGELCPNIQTDWMDKFKVDFANELINTLTVLSSNLSEENPNKNQLLCAIADCLLKFDVLNEEAIALKCAALCRLGKRTFAKQSYDLFCREYNQLLGVDFSSSFKELVDSK